MHTLEQLRRGELAGSRRLRLACGLSEFPREIFTLADTLEILDLSGNALASLPDDLPRLHKLRIVFCSANKFEILPAVLGHCPNLSMIGFKSNRIRQVPPQSLPGSLRWLILTDNAIEALPDEIGHCSQLQKLMLAGNQLRELPRTLDNCTRLELLRIAANRLDALPDWLLDMPRLSWLAFAGNPFTASLEARTPDQAAVDDIPWPTLSLHDKLGEGASGVIYRGEQRAAPDVSREVAVKLFKGAITSDGLPHCEMAACIRAGDHPNLIPVHGKVADHPEDAHGLVMALIDSTYGNLAGPPSLESCTRDIYAPTTRFTPETALRIAHGIASSARHLHERGILHGDLYGHNILHSPEGKAVIGDFGAASFYPSAQQATAQALERLEVRAFGCLLEELLARIDGELPGKARLEALAAACLDDKPARRPAFAKLEENLASHLPARISSHT